jgi:hypothetical protein
VFEPVNTVLAIGLAATVIDSINKLPNKVWIDIKQTKEFI